MLNCVNRFFVEDRTPSILRRSANDVELGPCSLAHSAMSQSTFDANGLYGFEGEGFPSELAYALCDGEADPTGLPARASGNLTTLVAAQVRWQTLSGGGVGGGLSSISLGGSDRVSGSGRVGGSQPNVVSSVKKSSLSSSLLPTSSVTLGPGYRGLGGVGVGTWAAETGGVCGGEAWCGVGVWDIGDWDVCFWRMQIGPERPDRRFFARRRQSGSAVWERCALWDVNCLRQPGHFRSPDMIR